MRVDQDVSSPAAPTLQIHEASRRLGVPAPTLRSWERRYALTTTARTPGGHRRYTEASLTQLGQLRDEIARGRPPAEAARRIRSILDETGAARPRVARLMAGSAAGDPRAIRAALDDARADLRLAATLDDVVLPLMRQVGSWWETGRCDIGQEHLTTEALRGWLAKATVLAPRPTSPQWVLLATGPGDLHTVGLEALGALLATQGTGCRLLGPRTPLRVLVAAVHASAPAAAVVVSHQSSQRRSAVESLDAVHATGCPTFYAGNAFALPRSRVGVDGSYLGETMTGAVAMIRGAPTGELPPTRLVATG